MIRISTLIIVLLLQIRASHSQNDTPNKTKLTVGIVIDHMRCDHLYKYKTNYSEGGFKRIVREGLNFINAHIDC